MTAFSRIIVGQILYDYHSYQTGVGRQMGEWTVRVMEIDTKRRKALCSWNGNAPSWYTERMLARLKTNRKARR